MVGDRKKKIKQKKERLLFASVKRKKERKNDGKEKLE